MGTITRRSPTGKKIIPSELRINYDLRTLRGDIFGGVTATIVALPVALAMVGLVALQGSFTVASAGKLVEVIGADIKDHEVVIFDFSKTRYLNDSAAMVVENLMNTALTERTDFIVMGLSVDVAHILHTLNILQHVPENCLVENMDEARDVAYTLLERRKSGYLGKIGSNHPNSIQLFVSIELIFPLQAKFPLKTPFMPSITRLKYPMPV